MGTQQELTTDQVAVLMWVKALNDFKDPDCPNDTLDDKIEKFDLISADLSSTTFLDGMNAIKELGVIDVVGDEEIYRLTDKGKALMVALSAIKGLSDETIKNILNGSIKVKDFVIEHREEIISIIITIMFNR